MDKMDWRWKPNLKFGEGMIFFTRSTMHGAIPPDYAAGKPMTKKQRIDAKLERKHRRSMELRFVGVPQGTVKCDIAEDYGCPQHFEKFTEVHHFIDHHSDAHHAFGAKHRRRLVERMNEAENLTDPVESILNLYKNAKAPMA